MAAPLLRGRALVVQRLWGLVSLAVLGALVALSVGTYQKVFTDAVTVTLQADRIGNQLTPGADVKARGVIVGEVRSVRPTADGAELELRLDPEQAARVPAGTTAQIVPKTLFGEKYVALGFAGTGVPAGQPSLAQAAAGDGRAVIAQDRSATARETSEALDSLLPLLQTLEPQTLSTTLNAVSGSLRGRGERIGSNLVLARDYFREINPELPTLARDNRGLADFNDTLTAATPDVLSLLQDMSVVNRNLVDSEADLQRFLQRTQDVAGTLEQFTADNEQRFVDLARESVPVLETFARYSPEFPCLADALTRQTALIGNTFGTLQPGLHITAEFTEDQGPYLPGDEPAYGEDAGPTCFGLVGEPIRPFPVLIEVMDGYCDEFEQSRPGVQQECEREGGDAGPESAEGAVVGRAVAAALGRPPGEVPDSALPLFAPLSP